MVFLTRNCNTCRVERDRRAEQVAAVNRLADEVGQLFAVLRREEFRSSASAMSVEFAKCQAFTVAASHVESLRPATVTH